jgi:putative addiction module component (TIGR02574 family)
MNKTAVAGYGFATIVAHGAPERHMTMPFADIESEALKLSPEERVLLAEHLLASVGANGTVEAAWEVEVERRLRELDAGEAETIPLEEAVKRARQALS